jgi:hypothetical protein
MSVLSRGLLLVVEAMMGSWVIAVSDLPLAGSSSLMFHRAAFCPPSFCTLYPVVRRSHHSMCSSKRFSKMLYSAKGSFGLLQGSVPEKNITGPEIQSKASVLRRKILIISERNKLQRTTTDASFADIVLKSLATIMSPRALASSANNTWLLPVEFTEDDPVHLIDQTASESELTPDAFVIHPSFLRRTSSPPVALCGAPAHESLFPGMGILNFDPDGTPASRSRLMRQLMTIRRRARLNHKLVPRVAGAIATRAGLMLVE